MKKILFLTVIYSLMLTACYRDDDYLPVNVDANSVILNLSASNNSIPADGQSFTYISVELPVDAVDSRSTVAFTTTKGTFDNNNKTISMAATLIKENNLSKRIAKVKLESSSIIETADITATVAGVTKVLSVSFTNLALDTFLSLRSFEDNIPADGVSFTTLTVEQPVNILADYTTITFTTTSGNFDNGTKTIAKPSSLILENGLYKRIAQVRLTSSKYEETATVEAAIKGTLKQQHIFFKKAYPDDIRLSLSAPSITGGFANTIQITSNLLRVKGIPTVNNEAALKVVDTNNLDRGIFINYALKSDVNGQITNKFTMGADGYKGRLKIIATGTDSSGAPLVDQVEIIAQ